MAIPKPVCPDCHTYSILDEKGFLKCPDYICGYEGPAPEEFLAKGSQGFKTPKLPSLPTWGQWWGLIRRPYSCNWTEWHYSVQGLMVREYLEEVVNGGGSVSIRENQYSGRSWSVEEGSIPPRKFFCKSIIYGPPTLHPTPRRTNHDGRITRNSPRYSTEEEAINACWEMGMSPPSGSVTIGEPHVIRCTYCNGFHVIPLEGIRAEKQFRINVKHDSSGDRYGIFPNPPLTGPFSDAEREAAKAEAQRNQRLREKERKRMESERPRNPRDIGRWFEEFDKHHGGDGSGDV